MFSSMISNMECVKEMVMVLKNVMDPEFKIVNVSFVSYKNK